VTLPFVWSTTGVTRRARSRAGCYFWDSMPLLDLPYGPDPAHRLDLYLPTTATGPAPVVLFLHGGGWSHGDKSPCPAERLTDLGFAVASANYRLTPTAPFPAQVHDAKAAVRWLRANGGEHGLDPQRIGVWGVSAGAHLAALLGTTAGLAEPEGNVGPHLDQSSDVQAVCDWFGPTDLAHFDDDARAAGLAVKPQWPLLIAAFLGGVADHRSPLVPLANPVRTASPAAPPFLIQHGDRDEWVPVGQSQRLADALAAAGVPHTFTIVPGAGHGPGFDAPAVRSAVVAFFARTLLGGTAPISSPS
jgi:acetyl esterase/lipase